VPAAKDRLVEYDDARALRIGGLLLARFAQPPQSL
jgi:hypothetical protein